MLSYSTLSVNSFQHISHEPYSIGGWLLCADGWSRTSDLRHSPIWVTSAYLRLSHISVDTELSRTVRKLRGHLVLMARLELATTDFLSISSTIWATSAYCGFALADRQQRKDFYIHQGEPLINLMWCWYGVATPNGVTSETWTRTPYGNRF